MILILKKLKRIISVVRHMGFFWLIRRVWYEFRLKSGLLSLKMPLYPWADVKLQEYFKDLPDALISDPCFFRVPFNFFVAKDELLAFDVGGVSSLLEANDVLNNRFTLFSKCTVDLGSFWSWHANPCENVESYPKVHWTMIEDSKFGDIKNVWELGRFSFVYVLIRAYLRTENEIYIEKFWLFWEDWIKNNSPNEGVHWKCGQEISIRLMSCIAAISVFYKSHHSTPSRIKSFLKFIVVSADRIENNIHYAVQQKNNHGVGEAIALWTVGVLFPTCFYASKWKRKGNRILEQLALELIYEDGSYAQHSINYTRVVLQYYLWMFVIARRLSIEINHHLKSKLRLAYQFLYQLHNAKNGRLPNYGVNDGSLIYHLSNCDFMDYRPILQCWHYYFTGDRCFQVGMWDEELLFFFGPEARNANFQKLALKDLSAAIGGYYLLRNNAESFLFIRCNKKFIHRPSQSDQLHVDIWWKGFNIAIDPGTYSYHSKPPWEDALSLSRFHNTVIVDHHDQMDKFGKFMWASWSSGQVIYDGFSNGIRYWVGAQTSYERLSDPVHHRRAIIDLGDEQWLVLDYLDATQPHDYTLHWLLNDFPFKWDKESNKIELYVLDEIYIVWVGSSSALISNLIRADETGADGWQSRYYQHKMPAISLFFSGVDKKILFWTAFGAKIKDIKLFQNELMVITSCDTFKISMSFSKDKIVENIIVEKHSTECYSSELVC